MMCKIPFAAAVAAVLPASAFGALTFPFTNGTSYQNIDFMDGNQGTQWSVYGKVGVAGSVTDYSSSVPDGSTSSPRQIGIGSDFGTGGSAGGQRGYLFSISDGTDNYFTPFTTFSAQTTSSVTWDMGNSAGSSTFVRLLVQSGGNWYATQTGYTTSSMSLSQFQSGATPFSVDITSVLWYAYNLSTLTVDTSAGVTLADGNNLTGVGFHMVNSTDNAVSRIDNLSIIPEPSALVLSAIGALGLLRRRR